MRLKILFADDQIPPDETPVSGIKDYVLAMHPRWDSRSYEPVVNGFVAMRQVLNGLRDHGYDVVVARTREIAIKLAETERFEVAIVDLAWVGDDRVPDHEQRNAGWMISDAIEVADRKAGRQPTPQIIYSSRFPEEDAIVAEVAKRKKLPVHKYYDDRDIVLLRAAIEFMDATFLSNRDQRTVRPKDAPSKSKVFLGHGQAPVWRDLRDFFEKRLSLSCIEFNSDPVAGFTTKERIEEMLSEASIAFLIMTGEDEHSDGKRHARENVIHEIGLFQGRFGFSKAIILLEDGCAEFSNVVGLTEIRFSKSNISAKFEEIRRVLERESVI